jgi:hypothetical protein
MPCVALSCTQALEISGKQQLPYASIKGKDCYRQPPEILMFGVRMRGSGCLSMLGDARLRLADKCKWLAKK